MAADAPTQSRSWIDRLLLWGACAVAAVLLLVNLGHYPLWGDEADTALFALGVWRTGDTSAVLDHNLYAYRAGATLRDLHGRRGPPLQYYLAAPSVGLLGRTAWAARLPFALCGVATFVVLTVWLLRRCDDGPTRLWMAIALVANASLLLHLRQGRYYALALLLSVVIAYVYLNRTGRRREPLILSLLMALLFAANYMNYAALALCLAVDYLLFERKRCPLVGVDWLSFFIPQIVLGSLVLFFWFRVGGLIHENPEGYVWEGFGFILFIRNLRDLNVAEFGVGLLLLAVPVVYWRNRDPWLLRGGICVLLYAAVVADLSPQAVGKAHYAAVRYLVPLIPLCLFLCVRVLREIFGRRVVLGTLVALVCFGANLVHQPFSVGAWRSTSWQFAREVFAPRSTAQASSRRYRSADGRRAT